MKIKEVFKKAVEHDLLDLQILIMFLVYEKQVLTMEDDKKELDLYFLPKHRKRMTLELNNYKKKLQLKEKPSVWRVITETETIYVYVENELQAKTYAMTLKYVPKKVEYIPNDDLFWVDGTYIEIGKLVEGKQIPSLIGTE